MHKSDHKTATFTFTKNHSLCLTRPFFSCHLVQYDVGMLLLQGEHAHSGFPEISYGRYAECLIQKGYKVARIEQTETPDMVAERCKQSRCFDWCMCVCVCECALVFHCDSVIHKLFSHILHHSGTS